MTTTTIRETKLVLFAADLAGYTRTIASMDAISVATFMNEWYVQCASIIRERGGRVVKYIGDGCLATFPEDHATHAVDAANALCGAVDIFRKKHGLRVEVSVKVHAAVVAEGELGPDDDPRYDVLGSGVNHLFLMGGGPGIRISEPVYRQLPNERRTGWVKNRPPATYSLK